MSKKLQVLALGDASHSELHQAFDRVMNDTCTSVVIGDANSNGDALYDLVLCFESRPGSLNSAPLAQLRQRLPFAGFVTVLGSWCEGETRTGHPLPYCQRVFWYHFESWWQRARTAWVEGYPASWQLPASAPSTATSLSSQQFISIDTPDADSAEALITACESMGAAAVWSPRGRTRPLGSAPAAGIWVGGQLDDIEAADLLSFRHSLPTEARLIVLLDFPRRDSTLRAIDLGATAVLGKPWSIDDLATTIDGEEQADGQLKPSIALL